MDLGSNSGRVKAISGRSGLASRHRHQAATAKSVARTSVSRHQLPGPLAGLPEASVPNRTGDRPNAGTALADYVEVGCAVV